MSGPTSGPESASVSGPTSRPAPPPVFPTARWVALAWLVAWGAIYWWWYGPVAFLQLCDISIVLTCIGLWRGSALLLSTQAVSSLVIDVAWMIDIAATLVLGRHVVGGTEYMWDTRYPLWLRLLSLFHVVWPFLLVWALRRTGYDRRALAWQSALAAVVMVLSRLAHPGGNLNFAHADPFLARQWGPAPVHLALMTALLVVCVYWPTHAVLKRRLPAAGAEARS